VEGFGQYGFALALAAIFASLAESGLFLHQSRIFPSLNRIDDISSFLADCVSLRLILGAIAGITLVVVGQVSGKGAAASNFIALLAASVLLGNVMGGYSSYLYGAERFDLYGLISSGAQLITTCIAIAALHLGWGLTGIGWAHVCGSLFALLTVKRVVGRIFGLKTTLNLSRRLFSLYKAAFPLGLAAILLIFYNRVNYTLVSFFSGDNVAGIYNAAFALINGIALLTSTFANILVPRFSIFHRSDIRALKNLYRASFRYLLILGVGITSGIIEWSKPLISAFFSEKYIESAEPLLILSLAGIFLYQNALQQALMIARQANRKLVKMILITLAVNLLAALALIPEIGCNGAALAMLAGEISGFVYGFAVNIDVMNFKKISLLICRILPASLACLLFIHYGGSSLNIISAAAAAAIYIVILIVTRALDKGDLGILMGALKK